MRGLDPRIHVFFCAASAVAAALDPGMTAEFGLMYFN